jgi:uncharacterized membrane protein YdjX (TVP38/TMEM64 family)|nr:TVP38/TMEM64 family protein [Bacillota bacterium]
MNRDTDRNLGPRWIVITLLAVGVGGVLYFGWPFFSAMGDPKQVERWILDAGAWGPAMFILLQIAQMLIAPLPGQIMALIGGYLFGSWIGLLYTMIGVMMGSALIFALARKLGRPFVRRFVRPHLLRKFDHLTREKGAFVFFLMYLLPGFPDDILSFIAGLTLIPVRRLLLISLVGRLPENAVLSFTGSAITFENINLLLVTLAAILLIYVYIWSKRGWIRKFAEHPDRIAFLKQTWAAKKVNILITACIAVVLAILMFQLAVAGPIYSTNGSG